MKNRWIVVDEAEPPVVWTLSFPAGDRASRARIAAAVVDALAAERVCRVVEAPPADEPLAYADALLTGAGRVVVESTIAHRAKDGAIVESATRDAGALLRSVEVLDDAYARRFAASRPVCAPWAELVDDRFVVSIGFWCDVYWQVDEDLRHRNAPRLLGAREALKKLAVAEGGVVDLPVPATL